MSFNLYVIRPICFHQNIFYISGRAIHFSLVKRDSNKLNVVIQEKNPSAPDTGKLDTTLVGPPHPLSNLRLKLFPNSKNLTTEEHFLYEKSRETQEWNQKYWEAHNKDFIESKESYINEIVKKKNINTEYSPNMDEMAIFYRQFLNKNYAKHVSYNWQWYRKNIFLIYLSAKAQLSKLKKPMKRDNS